jgi:hypothetical protein
MENPQNLQDQVLELDVSSPETDIDGTNPSENIQNQAEVQPEGIEPLKIQAQKGFRARINALFKKCGEILGLISAEMDTPKNPQNQELEEIDFGRRELFGRLFALGITLAIPLLSPSDARADYNPYQKKLTPVLEARYRGKGIPLEKLSPKEKILLNESMKVFWRTYLHFDFWHNLTTKAPAVEKILEIAMAKENREKLWYKGDPNGVMTIKSRSKGEPKIDTTKWGKIFIPTEMDCTQINIKISYGKITMVNGVKINHRTITRYNEDWKMWGKRIERISPKVALMSQLAGQSLANSVPPITDVEWGWFYQYSFEWPHRFYRLLELKGDLTEAENRLKNQLESLLENHPKSEADFLQNIEAQKRVAIMDPTHPEITPPPPASQPASAPASQPASAPASQNIPPEKSPQIIVWKRVKFEFRDEATGTTTVMPKTPDDMVELVLFADVSRLAFGGISQDGFVMIWRNGKWVRSDNSPMPFLPGSR